MKIGVDIGGSHIAIGMVSEEGKIISKKEEYKWKRTFQIAKKILF